MREKDTRKVLAGLKNCVDSKQHCEDCYLYDMDGCCRDILLSDAAEHIEEMERKLAERDGVGTVPYDGWISVEDEPLPKLGGDVNACWYFNPVDLPCFLTIKGNIEGEYCVTHWMRLEPPKPKEPTFKDVFLGKFPKAPIDEDGIPKTCIADVFPWAKHKHCDGWMCFEDWNHPYFEEEGGE